MTDGTIPPTTLVFRVGPRAEDVEVAIAVAPGEGSPTQIDRVIAAISHWCSNHFEDKPYSGFVTCSGSQLVEFAARSALLDDASRPALAALIGLARLWLMEPDPRVKATWAGAIVAVVLVAPLDVGVRFDAWSKAALPDEGAELRTALETWTRRLKPILRPPTEKA